MEYIKPKNITKLFLIIHYYKFYSINLHIHFSVFHRFVSMI